MTLSQLQIVKMGVFSVLVEEIENIANIDWRKIKVIKSNLVVNNKSKKLKNVLNLFKTKICLLNESIFDYKYVGLVSPVSITCHISKQTLMYVLLII